MRSKADELTSTGLRHARRFQRVYGWHTMVLLVQFLDVLQDRYELNAEEWTALIKIAGDGAAAGLDMWCIVKEMRYNAEAFSEVL